MSIMLEFEKELKQIEDKIHELEKLSKNTHVDADIELAGLYKKVAKMKDQAYNNMTPWEKVCTARLADRPTALDYINRIFDDFIEFHGDRNFGDDPSIVGGIARLGSLPVTVIGQQKGRTTKENIRRNFGMPHPEGYRKALRLMKQAEKFGRPIICLVDTPGAFCGIGAEERGQGEAIAKNLLELSVFKVPIISIVIGEGGSGGALAIGVADQVWMFEHSIYSILSPEGFASILWKDASRAKEAAGVMKLTAQDLKEFGVIEKVIEEPIGGAHKDVDEMANRLKENLENEMQILIKMSKEELLNARYQKLRFSYC
uniref:acetyl-CoA carboxylase carboxyltransferase subunit alpha n=1 Tax=Vallitalea okinawensis TaxID=2078660 RepID=UPI0038CDA1B0